MGAPIWGFPHDRGRAPKWPWAFPCTYSQISLGLPKPIAGLVRTLSRPGNDDKDGEDVMVAAKSSNSETDGQDRLAALSWGPEIMLNIWTGWLESAAKLTSAQGAFSRGSPAAILGPTSPNEK